MEQCNDVTKKSVSLHLTTVQGRNFPLAPRLATCVFLPRELRVALRAQLWKFGLSSAFVTEGMSYQRIDEAPQGQH